ncbi:hypothetical protein [Streptomyces sp. NPDC051665]|uniref:hypothetical protein n=1 Tax=Streptomyces sp. NPDC051665 TaxID=3154647 RepID=UPI003418F96A
MHEDWMPYGMHLIAADLPGAVCLPVSISVSGDPCMGWGRWQTQLAWRWPKFGATRPGHDLSCVYCVHGPDCLSCPPAPTGAGPLMACGPCGSDVLTAELRAKVRAEAYFESLYWAGGVLWWATVGARRTALPEIDRAVRESPIQLGAQLGELACFAMSPASPTGLFGPVALGIRGAGKNRVTSRKRR